MPRIRSWCIQLLHITYVYMCAGPTSIYEYMRTMRAMFCAHIHCINFALMHVYLFYMRAYSVFPFVNVVRGYCAALHSYSRCTYSACMCAGHISWFEVEKKLFRNASHHHHIHNICMRLRTWKSRRVLQLAQ